MSRALLALLFLSLVSLWPASSSADTLAPLSEIEVFTRCYQRMARDVPDDTHPLLIAVTSGKMAAVDACMKLFGEAQLDADGLMTNRSNAEAKRILKTFHDLHRTWFQSRIHYDWKPMTYLLKDGEEGALYYTRAAFQTAVQFKSIVTLNMGLQGIRDRDQGGTAGNDFEAQHIVGYPGYVTYSKATDAYVSIGGSLGPQVDDYRLIIPGNQIIQMGDLVGVSEAKKIVFPDFLGIWRFDRILTGEPDPKQAAIDINKAAVAMRKNFDANANLGGGILGSQNFLLNNAGLTYIDTTQGATGENMNNRRVASRIYEDLLCQTLPTLNASDVTARVQPNADLTFRRSESCQVCHAQMDQTANAFRNVYTFRTGINAYDGLWFMGIQKLPEVPGATTFAVQKPEGRLYYRQNLTGELINTAVSSIADVGTTLAAHDDLYRCAAKRYYQFFTGVDVSLSTKASDAASLLHQNLVMQLAADLKKDQSVPALIRRIVDSKVFRARNYQPEAP